MKWQVVNVSIPNEIASIYEEIVQIQKNACVAGGCLSDLYMGVPYKDVDIFIKNNPIKQKKIEALMEQKGASLQKETHFTSEYAYKIALDVKTYTLTSGAEVQLIFTRYGVAAPKYFDFRFREFLYFRGQTYATPEAIADITEKKLVFGVTKAPLVALMRAAKFELRYGFTRDEASFARYNMLYHAYKITPKTLDNYMLKINDEEIRQKMKQLIPQKQENAMESVTKAPYIRALLLRHITRDAMEEIENAMHRPKQVKRITFVQNPLDKPYQKSVERMVRAFRKIRLSVIYEDVVLADRWNDYTKDPFAYANKWIDEIVAQMAKRTSYLYLMPLLIAAAECSEIVETRNKIKESMNLTLDFENIWRGSHHHRLRDVYTGNYVSIRLVDVGQIIYDQKKQDIIYSSVPEVLREEMLKGFIAPSANESIEG
jgi:hypothetical protein